MRHSVMACATASFLALTLASGAYAQSSGRTGTVDDIIVTAQKRNQNLQDVPIVVTTVSKQLLQDANVKDIKDLTIVTPGLTVTSTSSEASTTARIRGVGTVGDNAGLESSVGVVIDGVYRPRNSVGFGDLGELQRIEVLKGPQGTLFGKNTTAGVINVITQRPKFTFGAEGEATVSNFNGYGLAASVTGPIVEDKVAGRLYVARREHDGYLKIRTGPTGPRTDDRDNNQDYYTVRGQLLFTPNAAFDVNLIADYTKRDEMCCAAVQIAEYGTTQNALRSLEPVGGGVAIPVYPQARIGYSNRKTTQDIEDKGISGEANWKTNWLGGATLTSITAYREWNRTGETDPDYSTVDVLAYDPAHQGTEFKQFSEELRLGGKTQKLDWLVGAFYANEELTQNTALRYGTQFEQYANILYGGAFAALTGRPLGTTYVAGQGQQDHYLQKEHNLAFFTNDTYHITDKFEATLGLRYTSEHKTLNSNYNNTDAGFGCQQIETRFGQAGAPYAALTCGTFQNYLYNNLSSHQTDSESETTGTFKLAYHWSKELFLYASYARGYKAGGFNLDRTACPYAVGTVGSAARALSDACIAQNASKGFANQPNPQAGAGNANSIQPLLDTSFKPEFVDSYETGFKSTLFNRSLLFNVTAFYQKYHDFQLNAFNGLVFGVTSVPEVISKGVDTDFVWFPTRNWTFQGGVTYADTRYTNNPANLIALGTPCTSTPFGSTATATSVPYGNAVPTTCSFQTGSRLSLAPLFSGSLSASYEQPLTADLVGRATMSAKYVSSYNTGSDLNPVKLQKSFTVINARLAIGPQSQKWSFELWAQNLLNQYYTQVAFDATAQSKTYNAFLGAPRTYGATLRAKF